MARPPQPHPTPAELEVLRILWDRGPSTVREVLELLPRERAYTSVMSLMNVMSDKKQLTRKPEGRAYRYTAKTQPDQTEGKILGSVLDRVFEGSASALVARLLEQSQPSVDELNQISRLIDEYKKKNS
jgi:predicted transcriptional regulator